MSTGNDSRARGMERRSSQAFGQIACRLLCCALKGKVAEPMTLLCSCPRLQPIRGCGAVAEAENHLLSFLSFCGVSNPSAD